MKKLSIVILSLLFIGQLSVVFGQQAKVTKYGDFYYEKGERETVLYCYLSNMDGYKVISDDTDFSELETGFYQINTVFDIPIFLLLENTRMHFSASTWEQDKSYIVNIYDGERHILNKKWKKILKSRWEGKEMKRYGPFLMDKEGGLFLLEKDLPHFKEGETSETFIPFGGGTRETTYYTWMSFMHNGNYVRVVFLDGEILLLQINDRGKEKKEWESALKQIF